LVIGHISLEVDPAQAGTPRPVGVRILVVKSMAEARQAITAFNAGVPFDRIVRERSIGPARERGGYLGRVNPGSLDTQARAALLKTRRGRLTPIFPTQGGFGVMQVLSEREERELEVRIRQEPEARDLLERGLERGQAGDLDGAVSLLRRTIELDPGLVEAHFNLAMAYRDLGQLDMAIAAMRQVVRLNPEDIDAYMRLGAWLFERDAFLDASQAFERAATLEMDSEEAWLRLAQSYDAAGKAQAAVGAYRQVLNLLGRDDPALYGALYRVAMRARNGPVAVEAARKLRDFRTGHEGFLALGDALLLNGENEAAVLELQKAVALAPSSAAAHAKMASAFARVGRVESAVESLLQAVQLEPDNPEHYRSLTRLYTGMGRVDLAIVALRDGVSAAAGASPRLQSELAEELAALYERAGMRREAERERNRAQSLRTP
jgi:Tfp pilus assembly protein PilF